MFAQQYIQQQQQQQQQPHPHQQQQQRQPHEYAVQTAPAFTHPPPLPLNAYTQQPQQPPRPQQQLDQKPFASAHDLNSPSTSAAPPAIARHHQQLSQQQPQQQQQQHTPPESFVQHPSLTHSPDFIDLRQDAYASQAQYEQDFQQQQHAYGQEFSYVQSQEYGQQPQQQVADFVQLQDEYAQLQDPHEYGVPGQPSFMSGIGGVNGLQSFGVKRPRGEKISSKDFVPPDVTGLSKREARLVKNRAAAFLSRQRKREEFEAMEHRVADLEQQNASLLAQLSGAMPVGDAAHEAHIRALQARIAGLEQELDVYRRTHGPQHGESRSPSPGSNSLKPSGHARGRSYDSFDSSLSGHSGASGAGRMTDTQREAVVGMGLMALLSLTSMSPPTTKFAFTPADNTDEPTPVTATPFNYDSIARWQERLAASASALPTVSGSPPEGTSLPVPTPSNPAGEATKAEFDIAFSTTDDGRIRCHVSVPKNQMAHIMAIHAAKSASQSQNQSFPNTPYSVAGSLHSSHSGASGSPESNGVQSHPGSASSFHTTFEAAGYQTQYAGQQQLQVNEDAWVAQHQQWIQPSHVQVPVQAQTMTLQPTQSQDWAASSTVTPVAPRPQQGPLAAVVKHEDKEQRKQLGPTRRVKVALKASSGRGEWEVEVC